MLESILTDKRYGNQYSVYLLIANEFLVDWFFVLKLTIIFNKLFLFLYPISTIRSKIWLVSLSEIIWYNHWKFQPRGLISRTFRVSHSKVFSISENYSPYYFRFVSQTVLRSSICSSRLIELLTYSSRIAESDSPISIFICDFYRPTNS